MVHATMSLERHYKGIPAKMLRVEEYWLNALPRYFWDALNQLMD